MARKPRIDAPGIIHHVMLRGNGGQAIFQDDADRRAFLDLATDGVERFHHAVVAYCLMGNHVHLVVRSGQVSISRVIQNLAFRYARHSHRRRQQSGHLFQGRFRSLVVDIDRYLLELVRYVHLNPVRAGLVAEPESWPWSSHRGYVGRDDERLVDTDFVLAMFAPSLRLARRRYASFVREGIDEPYREEFHRGAGDTRVMGDEEFARRFVEECIPASARRPASLDEVVACVCAHLGVEARELASPSQIRTLTLARALIAMFAQDLRAAPLTGVSRVFGRDATTLSAAVCRLRQRIRNDQELADVAEILRTDLSSSREGKQV